MRNSKSNTLKAFTWGEVIKTSSELRAEQKSIGGALKVILSIDPESLPPHCRDFIKSCTQGSEKQANYNALAAHCKPNAKSGKHSAWTVLVGVYRMDKAGLI